MMLINAYNFKRTSRNNQLNNKKFAPINLTIGLTLATALIFIIISKTSSVNLFYVIYASCSIHARFNDVKFSKQNFSKIKSMYNFTNLEYYIVGLLQSIVKTVILFIIFANLEHFNLIKIEYFNYSSITIILLPLTFLLLLHYYYIVFSYNVSNIKSGKIVQKNLNFLLRLLALVFIISFFITSNIYGNIINIDITKIAIAISALSFLLSIGISKKLNGGNVIYDKI